MCGDLSPNQARGFGHFIVPGMIEGRSIHRPPPLQVPSESSNGLLGVTEKRNQNVALLSSFGKCQPEVTTPCADGMVRRSKPPLASSDILHQRTPFLHGTYIARAPATGRTLWNSGLRARRVRALSLPT